MQSAIKQLDIFNIWNAVRGGINKCIQPSSVVKGLTVRHRIEFMSGLYYHKYSSDTEA